jgi:LuxR family maltose regulon positive regulatory protein
VRAEQWARSARQRAADLDLAPHEPGRLFAGLALAGVLWERTDDVAAATILEGVSDGVDIGRRPPLQSLVALRQAEFARLTGDEAAADSHLTRARLLLPTASPSVKATFAIEAAQQALRFQPATAADAIDDLDDSPAATVLRVKRALVDGHDGAAMALLDTLSPPTTPREHVERGVLCALAISRRDVEAANRQLADCLDVARSERFIRTIIDHGPMVSKLLSAFTPNRAVGQYVEELIDADSSMAAPLRQLVATPLVDPLSPRELTVLRYLSSRLTNQEIASALYVSLNTLKSHVKSVYRKLAVASRQEAVEAGRQLRLI